MGQPITASATRATSCARVPYHTHPPAAAQRDQRQLQPATSHTAGVGTDITRNAHCTCAHPSGAAAAHLAAAPADSWHTISCSSGLSRQPPSRCAGRFGLISSSPTAAAHTATGCATAATCKQWWWQHPHTRRTCSHHAAAATASSTDVHWASRHRQRGPAPAARVSGVVPAPWPTAGAA